MVAYSFNERFIDPILSGRKRQTIRALRAGRSRHARPGETLHLYTAMRTRRCRLIGTAPCLATTPIVLTVWGEGWEVQVRPGVVLRNDDGFAQADGFQDARDFHGWWNRQRPRLHLSETLDAMPIAWGDVVPGAAFAGAL